MKVLFIGGTGIISSASSRLALERGIDLYHLNRGKTAALRPVSGVKPLIADINDEGAVISALGDLHFDAVVDWIAFTPDQIERDIRLFAGRCDQFVFISSASVYQTPPRSWPVTEDIPADNPFWEYSRNKIACELLLHSAGPDFAFTIVRPSPYLRQNPHSSRGRLYGAAAHSGGSTHRYSRRRGIFVDPDPSS
jgi:nucleoside-diphosphate-sugar epimerase